MGVQHVTERIHVFTPSLLHCVSFSFPAAGSLSDGFLQRWLQLCSRYTAPCASTASASFVNEAMLLPAVVSQQHIQPQLSLVRAAMARLPRLFHCHSGPCLQHGRKPARICTPQLASGQAPTAGQGDTVLIGCLFGGLVDVLGRGWACRRWRWQGGAGAGRQHGMALLWDKVG